MFLGCNKKAMLCQSAERSGQEEQADSGLDIDLDIAHIDFFAFETLEVKYNEKYNFLIKQNMNFRVACLVFKRNSR